MEVIGRAVDYDEASLASVLSARHFVAVRTTHGGPAPTETARAIAASRVRLDDDQRWVAETSDRLTQADAMLKAASAAL